MHARLPAHIVALRIAPVPTHKHFNKSFSIMPSSDPQAKNASGLTPTETKALKERSPEEHEKPIIQSIKEVSRSPTE